jgi:alpha-mannosidase
MKKVPLIGTSHIDPAWLWEWQDGYSEVLATFRSALDRMKEFPEMRYTASSAAPLTLISALEKRMVSSARIAMVPTNAPVIQRYSPPVKRRSTDVL